VQKNAINLVNAAKQGSGLLGHGFLNQVEHFTMLGDHVRVLIMG
jgi:hypothetical protein